MTGNRPVCHKLATPISSHLKELVQKNKWEIEEEDHTQKTKVGNEFFSISRILQE